MNPVEIEEAVSAPAERPFDVQALSAFSASARKPSVRAGLAKTWARVLAHVSGSGLSTSVLAGWSGIEALANEVAPRSGTVFGGG